MFRERHFKQSSADPEVPARKPGCREHGNAQSVNAFPAEKALDKSVPEARDYALFPLPDKRFVSGGLFKNPTEQCLHLFRIFRLIPEVIQ